MSRLAQSPCVACDGGAPRTAGEALRALLREVPDWRCETRDGVEQLERTFAFANFAEALAFTNAVGALAEEHNHHPSLLTEWGRVRVTWWTHTIKGLHRNDFVMAAKTDQAVSTLCNSSLE